MLTPSIKRAFKASSPALVGYITLGMAFGFLFQKAGAAWFLAPIMSLLVYAGAAQFVVMGLLVVHGSIGQIAATTFFVNLRFIFYGISFVGKFNENIYTKAYMIFGLTDEAYAILTTNKSPEDKHYNFLVIFFAHMYWVAGTLMGSVIGSHLKINFSFMQFSLTALFIVLAIEQAYDIKKWFPFVVAFVASMIAIMLIPNEMIVTATLLAGVVLVIHYKILGIKA